MGNFGKVRASLDKAKNKKNGKKNKKMEVVSEEEEEEEEEKLGSRIRRRLSANYKFQFS